MQILDGAIFRSAACFGFWDQSKHPRTAHGHFASILGAGDTESKRLLEDAHKSDVDRHIAADKLEDVGRYQEANLLRNPEQHPAVVLGGSVLRLHGDLEQDGSLHIAQTAGGHRLTIRHGDAATFLEIGRHRGRPTSNLLAELFSRQQKADQPLRVLTEKEQKSLARSLQKYGRLVVDRDESVNIHPQAMPQMDDLHPSNVHDGGAASYDREYQRRHRAELFMGHRFEDRPHLVAEDFWPKRSDSGYVAPNARARERVVRRLQERIGIPLRPDGLPVHRLAFEGHSTNNWEAERTLQRELRDWKIPYFSGYGTPQSYDSEVRDGYSGFGFKDAETLNHWKKRAKELGISIIGEDI